MHTLAEVLGIGALVTIGVARYYDPTKPGGVQEDLATYSRLLEIGSMDVPELEQFLFDRLVDGRIQPDDTYRVIVTATRLLASPQRQRELVDKALADIFTQRNPGRVAMIASGEEPELARLAERYLPAARRLLDLLETFPSKSADELIELMAGDYLDDATALAQHASTVNTTLLHSEFAELSTANARAQYLADAIAGDAFEIGAAYAHQRAQVGRKSSTTEAT